MFLGQTNQLTISRFATPGAYLVDDQGNEVLLPNKYTEGLSVGELISVFIYKDAQARLVAVTDTPLIELYNFAYLTCKRVDQIGAFMDWGMEKDLLVPYREQRVKMEEGEKYIIYLDIDEKTERLYGSSRFERFLEKEIIVVNEGDEVDLLIAEFTELGCKVIINDTYLGLIFNNQLVKPLTIGQRTKGYIKEIRADGKIDVVLEKQGYQKVNGHLDQVLQYLKENNGISKITDHSTPEMIKSTFGMSKKTFKQVIGNLYKQQLIVIENDEIRLINP